MNDKGWGLGCEFMTRMGMEMGNTRSAPSLLRLTDDEHDRDHDHDRDRIKSEEVS